LKVKTDIISSISASPLGRYEILVIMYDGDYQNGGYCFNEQGHNVFDITLTDNFQSVR